MKTTILADIATIALLGYLILDDGDIFEYVLLAVLIIVTIIKWLTTPRKADD